MLIPMYGPGVIAWACISLRSELIATSQLCATEREAWMLAEEYRQQRGTQPDVVKVRLRMELITKPEEQ